MKHHLLLIKLEMSWHTYCCKMIDTFSLTLMLCSVRRMPTTLSWEQDCETRNCDSTFKIFLFHTFCQFKNYMNILFFKKENGRIRPQETAILVLIGPHPDDLLNFFQMIFFLSKVSLTELLTGIYRVILKGCVFEILQRWLFQD